MDYHSLPRKQLQALCKKHGIPANATNSEMADALTSLLQPKPQVHAENSIQEHKKRTTRSRELALSGTVSKSKDVEESSMKLQKANSSHKILDEDSNRKPQRVTRGRGSASAVSEAPKSAPLKTEKTSTNGKTETNSTKQQETKKVSTRNGASKQNNSEMPTKAEENVDSRAVSPKVDKKKEKAGGIVLRRGRVKVRSPGNLSKSPESETIMDEVTVTAKERGVGMLCSQSCLVNAKKTRKKKRSVTFSDLPEIKSACIEDPAKEVMAEIQQGADSNLPKNINSACMATKVKGTRKASRSISPDVIAAQAARQKSSKEPGAKVSKAERLHNFDAEKTANVEISRESDRKRAVPGKKILNSVGKAAAKENEEAKIVDGFVRGDHVEDVPCTRRSRRLTIAPTDVKFDHDRQVATESKDHDGLSIAPKKTEGDLPAETSRRSRRKTLAPIELNQVQCSVGSPSVQMKKKISKAENTGHNQLSEGANSISCNEELKYETDVRSPNTTHIHNAVNDSETANSSPIKDTDSIKPDAAAAIKNPEGTSSAYSPQCMISMDDKSTPNDQISEGGNSILCNEELADVISPSATAIHCAVGDSATANSSPIIEADSIKPEAPAAIKNPEFTEGTSSASFPQCMIARDDRSTPNDQISEGAHSISCNEELEYDTDVRSPSTTAIHCAVADSETALSSPIIDSDSIKPDAAAAIKNPDITEGTSSASSPQCMISRDDRSTPNDQISEAANSFSCIEELEYDTDVRNPSTTAIHCAVGDSETVNSSPIIDTDSIKPDAAAVIKNSEFTEGTSSASSPQRMISGNNRSIPNDQTRQLSPLLSLCRAESGIALPRESACKTIQRRPRSIYKSARKAKFLSPWESSLEQTTAPHPDQEASLNSLEQVEKDAEIWGLNNHETCDKIDSASSEDEETSAETEETLSDVEFCNFDTERLISNTEGDYSCSEDDTPSDSEKDTMSDSEDYFSEMEGELLSGEECYESEEQKTSEEELSDSEDESSEIEDDAPEEYEVCPVPQSVAISERFKDLGSTHGLENQHAEILAASKSSLPNDGLLTLESNVEPSGIDENVGGHEEFDKPLSMHAVTEIQENVDVQVTYNDNIAIESNTFVCAPNVEPSDINENVGGQHEEFGKPLSMPAVTEIQENVDVQVTYNNDNIAIESNTSVCAPNVEPSGIDENVHDVFEKPLSMHAVTEIQENVDVQVTYNDNIAIESNTSESAPNVEPSDMDENVGGQHEEFEKPLSMHAVIEIQENVHVQDKDNIAIESNTSVCAPNIEPSDIDGNVGGQHEESQKLLSMQAVTEIQENVDTLVTYTDLERVQLATTCRDSDSLASLFISPPSKVKEDYIAGGAIVDPQMSSPKLVDNVEKSQLLQTNSKNAFISVKEVHEKNLGESQSSEESKEDKEIAAAHDILAEVSKEQSMKQIDLTLLSVRELRQMCKGKLQMSAKKKTENETPARTPSRVWMSATKQVHQPNTSMHPRDLPSANKRSALKALSSNIKATSSTPMQTPTTVKGLQRPRNLMSNYDGNDGTGKHLVTPSPQAPMSSKWDFARSHHR